MDKEKQLLKIAELLGWKWDSTWFASKGKWNDFWKNAEGESFLGLPDWVSNLNAIHQAVIQLTDDDLDKCLLFDKHLAEIPHIGFSWAADAEDFCEALLKTFEVWEE